MAKLSKSAARNLIQQLLDDPGGKLWNETNLDTLAEGVLDELWGDLLDNWPWLRSTETAALTPTSPGYIDLSTGLGTTNRFYRLQDVVRNRLSYIYVDPRDVLVSAGEAISANASTYTMYGFQVHLFPYSLSADVYLRYASLPTGFNNIDEADPVEWPDGYHLAYCYEVAARAIEKGDRESSEQLSARAQRSLFRLKAFLRKLQPGSVTAYVSGDDGLDGV